jgi:hypothetical protein
MQRALGTIQIKTDEVIMATQLTPAQSVAQCLTDIGTHCPNLPQPQQGTVAHALLILQTPEIDATFCQQAGKVVYIKAKLDASAAQVTQTLSLRSNVDWTIDHRENPLGQTPNFYERTFTVHIPPTKINEEIQCKLCIPPVDASCIMRWQTGDNWTIDLKNHGHIVQVEVNGVKFN